MLHDSTLLDQLSSFTQERFIGEVFRATRGSIDPTSPSTSGGRWAPPNDRGKSFPILYTSNESDGAVAEVASYLLELSPVPKDFLLKVTQLKVSAHRVIAIDYDQFEILGIDKARYGERDYMRTQEIGAALMFLGVDGLLAPSARWKCSNLMLFADNHSLDDVLEVVDWEDVMWRSWAVNNGRILDQ